MTFVGRFLIVTSLVVLSGTARRSRDRLSPALPPARI